MKPLPGIVFVVLLFLVPVLACGQDKSEESADFPPGVFSNGQKYHLADFKGKVVVLLFFDGTWQLSGLPGPVMTQITDPVRKYRGEPFKFIVVASGARPAAAAAFARGLGLNLPVFSDSLALLEKRFGLTVAGRKSVRFIVLSPTGSEAGSGTIAESTGANNFTYYKDVVEQILSKQSAEWKYSAKDYDAKLEPALKEFEWGQYEAGMKLLTPLRTKSPSKKVKASADQLYDELKKQGAAWKDEAEKAAEEQPVLAYDLYARINRLFAKDDLAKEVAEPLKTLKANKTVHRELEARKDMAKLDVQLTQLSMAQRKQAATLLKGLAKRFPETPTAKHAEAMAKELSE
jgi:AhpC/TSA family